MGEILKDPKRLVLGGEEKRLTVLFSDIRGFTSVSETLKPQVLVKLMNDYLTPMTDIVLKNGGTIDKYMGDAIMAFWGAPV
ncbi:MAG: adenylate/guanylate cyclase domain-containing protein [Deltaproteobacteria bacterium]|nr:adenylate/guanylate cyclase domain-containing protein [Deltaproteobacteria bacterium]